MEGSQRLTRAVRSRIATRRGVADFGGLSQVLGDRMVGRQRPTAALQGVLAQGAGRLRLAQLDQGEGQGGGRPQGDRVVRAERPAAARQGVLAQGAGRLRFTQRDQGEGQGGCRVQGGGVVAAERPAAARQGVLAQGAGRLRLTQRDQSASEGRSPPTGSSGGPGRAPGGCAAECPRPGRGLARPRPAELGRGSGCSRR